MKKSEKILLIIMLLVAVFSLFMVLALSTPAAEMHGDFQVGYIKEIKSFEINVSLQFLPWRWLTIYGGISVLLEHYEGISFCPYRDTYIIGAKINITKNLYVDYYHSCTHPVFSYEEQFYDKFAGGDKTMISIGVEW